jgi:hypothetical protein
LKQLLSIRGGSISSAINLTYMKKLTNIIGYITALAIMVTAVFKFEHFSGAGALLNFTGLLLGIYFPVYVLDKMSESAGGKLLPLYAVAALCASLTELGITFRLSHWPGAGILLTAGLTGFSLIFLPWLLVWRRKHDDSNNLADVAGALGLAAFAMGILCKLQHWPAAAVLLFAGPVFIFLVYLPAFLNNRSIDSEIKRTHLRDCFFVIVVGTLLALYFIKSIEIHDAEYELRMNRASTHMESN